MLVLCYTILQHTILHITICYAMLCYATLRYATLCCAVLCCAIVYRVSVISFVRYMVSLTTRHEVHGWISKGYISIYFIFSFSLRLSLAVSRLIFHYIARVTCLAVRLCCGLQRGRNSFTSRRRARIQMSKSTRAHQVSRSNGLSALIRLSFRIACGDEMSISLL